MSPDPRWSYLQARLQARHGQLLTDADWRALDAARSLEHFLDRAKAGALRRFTAALHAAMSSHAMERALRQSWHAYVAEVGDWVPRSWQPAVLWVGAISELPALAALARGEAPAWIRDDPALAVLAQGSRPLDVDGGWLAPLLPPASGTGTVAARWFAHWRSLWPDAASAPALDALAGTVREHFELLARAGASQQSSGPWRRSLAQQLARGFRRHPASPVAVVAHLGLVALELERLRGGIVRRRLFAPALEAA